MSTSDDAYKSAAELAAEAKSDSQRSEQLWDDAKEAKRRGDVSGYRNLKSASDQLERESKAEKVLSDKKYNE